MMVKFQRLIIMAVILLGCNFAKAELVVEPNGRVRVPTGGFNQNGVRTWRYLDNGRGGMGGNMFYHEIGSKSLAVREASTGLRSASTVPVTVEHRVARSTVLKNLLSKARVGGKFLKVGGGPVGFAVSTAAFYLVDAALQDEGYEYNADHENFGKTEPDYGYCVSALNTGERCSKYRIDLKQDYWQEGAADNEALQQAMCKLAYAKGYFFNPVPFTPTDFGVEGLWCVAYKRDKGQVKNSVLMSTISYVKYKGKFTPISQSDFDRIVGPKADSAPSQYVNATANEDGSIPGESQSTPTVPNGTVITLGPATGQDGRSFQITISFTTSDGKTTAKVTTTPRPDLTPGSPAAPKTNPTPTPGENGKPGSQPDPNPDGKPGSQPDPTPDGSPSDKTKPDPDDSPSGKDKPKPDDKPDPDGKDYPKKDERPKEDDKPKEDGGLLCKVFPNILACDELPEKEEPNLEIPQETIDLNFTPDNTFSEYGECPAPVTFQALGAEYKISLEPACNLAAMMRPFIIAMAWLVASFFVARVVRNNA